MNASRKTPEQRDATRLPRLAGSRGAALVEFALVIPLILLLIMVTIDFGHLVQTRLILTNVAREAGSIGSRQRPLDSSLPDMMLASARPLDFGGADARVYVTRIASGQDAASPNPTVEAAYERGGLNVVSDVVANGASLGLTAALYDRLTFKLANNASDIKDVTVVETYFLYRPITPLPNFMPGLLTQDGGGVIIRSRAVF